MGNPEHAVIFFIYKLEMHIPSLGMRILRLKMDFLHGKARFVATQNKLKMQGSHRLFCHFVLLLQIKNYLCDKIHRQIPQWNH